MNRVPMRLNQSEFFVKLQINCVVGSHLDVLIFFNISSLELQYASLSVKEYVFNLNGQSYPDSVAGCGSCGALVRHFPEQLNIHM